MVRRQVLIALLAVSLVVLAQGGAASAGTDVGAEGPIENSPTPLLVRSADAVIPVQGVDGRTHLVWEVPLQNASGLDVTVTEIVVTGDGEQVLALDEDALGGVVEQLGTNTTSPLVKSGAAAYLYLTASFESPDSVPATLLHTVTVEAKQLPEPLSVTGGSTVVARNEVVPILGPPLAPGDGFVVAGGCCDPQWHIRSPIPVDNNVWFAQRFAIDWVQIDEAGRMRDGDRSDPASYTIDGHDIVAAAAGTVVQAVDGLEDQTAGEFPEDVPFAESDGNSVIVDIGNGLYTLYGHMQQGSVTVAVGDRIEVGQILGKVGNSGNSIVPHLHFQVMDRQAALASNGRPYVIDAFAVTEVMAPYIDFIEVETSRRPLRTVASDDDGSHADALPLDGNIVSFPGG